MADPLSRPPIEPIFHTDQPNSMIDFGPIDIVLPENKHSKFRQTTARAELQLIPEVSLRLMVPINTEGFSFGQLAAALSRIDSGVTEIEFPRGGPWGH